MIRDHPEQLRRQDLHGTHQPVGRAREDRGLRVRVVRRDVAERVDRVRVSWYPVDAVAVSAPAVEDGQYAKLGTDDQFLATRGVVRFGKKQWLKLNAYPLMATTDKSSSSWSSD